MKLIEVLLACRSITTEYHKQHDSSFPVRTTDNGLRDIVERQTNQKISTECLPWPGDMFMARLDRYEAQSNIWYSTTLNTCWARFVIAKELTHIICGDEKNFTTTAKLETLIETIINDLDMTLTEEMEDCLLEYQAFFGAIELLIPEHLYEELYLDEKKLPHREIAEKYLIPEKMLALRLNKKSRRIFEEFAETK